MDDNAEVHYMPGLEPTPPVPVEHDDWTPEPDWYDVPFELQRVVARTRTLQRLNELAAPAIIIDNQRSLVRKGVADALVYLGKLLDTVRDTVDEEKRRAEAQAEFEAEQERDAHAARLLRAIFGPDVEDNPCWPQSPLA